MAHYAQVYESVGTSKDFAFLLEKHPLAAALFLASLPRADAYDR